MTKITFSLKPMTNSNQLIKAQKKGHLMLFPEATRFEFISNIVHTKTQT